MITSDDLFQAFTRVPEIRKAETEGFCVAASQFRGGRFGVGVYFRVYFFSLLRDIGFSLKTFLYKHSKGVDNGVKVWRIHRDLRFGL